MEGGFVGAVLFEAIEIFEEEEPGGLFGVVEFGGAARLLAENVVNVLEGLLKHGSKPFRWQEARAKDGDCLVASEITLTKDTIGGRKIRGRGEESSKPVEITGRRENIKEALRQG